MKNQKLTSNHKFSKREATQRPNYMEKARELINKYNELNAFPMTLAVHKSCFEQLKIEFPNLLITRDSALEHLYSGRNQRKQIMISVTYPEN